MIKQIYGQYFSFGAYKNEIYPIWLSLWNWGAINGELIDLSDNFSYFLCEEDNYIWGRATAFCNNWSNYWLKTHNGKLIWKLATLKAKKELQSIKLENFLTGAESIENNEFSTGWIPNSLDSLNNEGIIFKEYTTMNGAIKQNDKIEFNKAQNYGFVS